MTNSRVLLRFGLGIGCVALQTIVTAQTQPVPALTCSPEMPVVAENGSLTLWAWARSDPGHKPDYRWSADRGSIAGDGSEVRWSLAGVPARPRAYQATVKVSLGSGDPAACSVQVFVGEKDRGGRETGGAFLVKGEPEKPGYGLYSYLLLGSRPTSANRERYLKVLQAYTNNILKITDLETYFPPNRLNVAYLPVASKVDGEPSADWLIDWYDYARARALLNRLPGNLREGVFLISVLQPLGSGGPVDHYLFQDLSAVPTKNRDILSWWIREFLSQAAQERYWEPRTAELLALRIRTTIDVMAEGLPDVQKALAGWISWLH